MWGDYVAAVTRDHQPVQRQTAERTGVSQPTIGRWIRGQGRVSPASVAAFCRAFGRNPLEGFVAAGMLEVSEAGRGLSKRERDFLASLGITSPTDPMGRRDRARVQRRAELGDDGDTPESATGA